MDHNQRILFVCHGNIFRSAFSHYLLQNLVKEQALSGTFVRSAGTIAKEGDGSDAIVVKVAEEYGLQMGNHKSVRLTSELLQWPTRIFVMEASMISDVEKLDSGSAQRTRLLGSVANPDAGEIEDIGPDPDVEGAVRDRFRRLERLVLLLTKELADDHPAI